MAILGNGLKGSLVSGLAIGVGAAIVAPVIVPILASVAKPLAKAVIKSGLLLYEKGREVTAEATEVVEDIFAEAQAEVNEAQKALTDVPPEDS